MTKDDFVERVQYLNDEDCTRMWRYHVGCRYDYRQAVVDDVKDYIRSEIDMSDYFDRDELEAHLCDVLWVDDSVTGNASGSYTFNSWKAEEYICHNMDLLSQAMEEFCCEKMPDSVEACDVIIRCYLLGEAISAALDELWAEEEEEEEEED